MLTTNTASDASVGGAAAKGPAGGVGGREPSMQAAGSAGSAVNPVINGQAGAGATVTVASPNPLGASCSSSSECESRSCTDGVCCRVSSCDGCQKCGTTGVCQAITSAQDPMAALKCQSAGDSCTPATQTCVTASCVDGACCSASSCGICSSCALVGSEGHCSAVSGVDDLDTCTGRQSCSGGKCADVSASEDLAVATLGSYFGQFGSSKQQLAQTLTVDAAGQLIEVRLAVALDWQDSFTVGIYAVASDGTPSPTQLASVPTAVGTTPVLPSHGSGVQYRSLALVTALQVSAGERIAIVVDAPNNTQNCLWYGSRDDVYAGGSAYVLAQGQATWSDQRNDLAVASLILR